MKLKFVLPILALVTGCSTVPSQPLAPDYDGLWVASFECGARPDNGGPSFITRRYEWTVVNGQGSDLNPPQDHSVSDWTVTVNNGQVLAQGRVTDKGRVWSYNFTGKVTSLRKFQLEGYSYDGHYQGRQTRPCTVKGVLFKPAANSLAGRL